MGRLLLMTKLHYNITRLNILTLYTNFPVVRWITLPSQLLRVAWILDYLDVAAHRREIAGPWLGYLPRQAQR